MIFLDFIYLLSMTVWIGNIVFFSFLVAPSVFKSLDQEKAGEVVGVIFPKYYLLGYAFSTLAIVTLATRLQSVLDWRLRLLATMLGCLLSAGKGVGSKARAIKNKIKDSGGIKNNSELKTKFDRLHSISVRLNGATLFLGLTVLWLTAENLKLH